MAATSSCSSPGISPFPSPMLLPHSPHSTTNPITTGKITNTEPKTLGNAFHSIPLQISESQSKILPSTSNISLLSLSFSNNDPEQSGSTVDVLQERNFVKDTGRQHNLLHQQQFHKSNSPAYSSSPYLSNTQQQRVGHYLHTMGSGSRPGSHRDSGINLTGLSPSNSSGFTGSQYILSTTSRNGSPILDQFIPASSSRSLLSYAGYSVSPKYLSPGSGGGSSINGMIIPDSPNLGPISLCNSPTKLLLNQTPPVSSRLGSSLSKTNSSTSLYQQHQQQLLCQHIQQQQLNNSQKPHKDQSLLFGNQNATISNVLGNPVIPPKQSGISKTFSHQRESSNTMATENFVDCNLSFPNDNLKTADHKMRDAVRIDKTKPDSDLLQKAPLLHAQQGEYSGIDERNVIKIVGIGAKDRDIKNTATKPINDELNHEKELRKKQKTLKTSASITAALNSEILKKKRHEKKYINTTEGLATCSVGHISPKEHDTNLGMKNNEYDGAGEEFTDEGAVEESALASDRDCKEIPPLHLWGKVLGFSSTPIAIPTTGKKNSSNNISNAIQKEKQMEGQQTDFFDNCTSSAKGSSFLVNEPATMFGLDNSSTAESFNSDENTECLTSASTQHFQSQSKTSDMRCDFASSLNMDLDRDSEKRKVDYEDNGKNAQPSFRINHKTSIKKDNHLIDAEVYANQHMVRPQLIVSSIDKDLKNEDSLTAYTTEMDTESLSKNLDDSLDGYGTPNTTAMSGITSTSLAHSLVSHSFTPDSPSLNPVSMTPHEGGLMTPMTLDPLSSQHASLVSVDQFFHSGMTPTYRSYNSANIDVGTENYKYGNSAILPKPDSNDSIHDSDIFYRFKSIPNFGTKNDASGILTSDDKPGTVPPNLQKGSKEDVKQEDFLLVSNPLQMLERVSKGL